MGDISIGSRNDPLPGRAFEARLLSDLLARASSGERRALLLTGEAGIGKSATLDAACSLAKDAGFRVARLRATATTMDLDAAVALLRAALGSADQPSAPSDLARVLALAAAMTEAARTSPLLISVDDLHLLADGIGASIADAVAMADGGIALVATTRSPADPWPAVQAGLWTERRRLERLDIGGLERLATGVLGGPMLPSALEVLHARTWGNPLFARETLRLWKLEGHLDRVGSAWALRSEDPPVATHLQDALTAAVRRLDQEAAQIMRALAVFGRPVLFDELQAVCRLDAERLTSHLASLSHEEMLRGSPRDGYSPAHPGHADAVLAGSDTAALAALSEAIVDLLRAARAGGRPVSPLEMAAHAVRALHVPADLVEILTDAAGAAEAAGTVSAAARWYGELVRALPGDDPRRPHAIAGWATALSSVEPERSADLFAQARTLWPEEPPIEVLTAHGSVLSTLGRTEESEACYRSAAARTPGHLVIRTRLATLLLRRDRNEGIRMLEEISEEGGADAAGALGFLAYEAGDLRTARERLEAGLRMNATPSTHAFLRTSLAWVLTGSGDWDDAAGLFESTMREAAAAGDLLRAWRLASGAVRLFAYRGDIIRSLDLASQTLRSASVLGGPYLTASALLALAECHMEAGAPAEALAATQGPLEALIPRMDEATRAIVGSTLLEARIATSDRSVTREDVESVAALDANDATRRLGIARLRAQHRLLHGDPAGALEAVEPWLTIEPQHVFEHARVQQVAAEALWRLRRRAAARETAMRALHTYERLGARLRQAAVAAWLYERFGASGSNGEPDPHGLSTREREVMTLAAEGLTNAEIGARLFISPGTAKKHIENILGKTGARRRSDLHRFLDSARPPA